MARGRRKGPNAHEALPGGLIRMELSQGQVTLFDVADLALVLRYRWHARWCCRPGRQGAWYAATKVQKKTVYLHRLLLACGARLGDHRNGDSLDNRRLNLRAVDSFQNAQNSRHRLGRAGVRGAIWHGQKGQWWARIRVRGRVVSLGLFSTAEEAARAYRVAADELHGEHAAHRGVLLH